MTAVGQRREVGVIKICLYAFLGIIVKYWNKPEIDFSFSIGCEGHSHTK